MVKGSAFDGEGGGNDKKFEELSQLARRRALARRLTEYLHSKGLKPADMHRATGLTRQQISQYLHAKATPSDASLYKLARAMGVRVEDLAPDRRVSPDAPSITVATSADGKMMRLAIDAWVPLAVGGQIITMVSPYVPADGE